MQSTLSVIDQTGDTEYSWDINNQDQIDIAREVFEKHRRKNYLAYKVKKSGRRGRIINEFDPRAGKIVLIPPVVGG